MNSIDLEPAERKRRLKERAVKIRRNARLLHRLGFEAAPGWHEMLDEVGARVVAGRRGVASHYWLKDFPFTRVAVEEMDCTDLCSVVEYVAAAAYHQGERDAREKIRQSMGVYQ